MIISNFWYFRDEVDEDANLPTETVNREQFTSDFVLHNTNPPETDMYQSQNMNQPGRSSNLEIIEIITPRHHVDRYHAS